MKIEENTHFLPSRSLLLSTPRTSLGSRGTVREKNFRNTAAVGFFFFFLSVESSWKGREIFCFFSSLSPGSFVGPALSPANSVVAWRASYFFLPWGSAYCQP